MKQLKMIVEGDEKKILVSPNEYIELLQYKGRYESMKEAYEKLLRIIETCNTFSSYQYPKITYGPDYYTTTTSGATTSYSNFWNSKSEK